MLYKPALIPCEDEHMRHMNVLHLSGITEATPKNSLRSEIGFYLRVDHHRILTCRGRVTEVRYSDNRDTHPRAANHQKCQYVYVYPTLAREYLECDRCKMTSGSLSNDPCDSFAPWRVVQKMEACPIKRTCRCRLLTGTCQ